MCSLCLPYNHETTGTREMRGAKVVYCIGSNRRGCTVAVCALVRATENFVFTCRLIFLIDFISFVDL